MEFCKQFNAATQAQSGTVIPVVITVYADRSFTFICKSPPAAVLIKKAAGVASAAKKPGFEKAGKITLAQVKEIVQIKKEDMNARDEAAAMKIIIGTARSMGIEVVDA
jgi:large subunit ribosomal protein L11